MLIFTADFKFFICFQSSNCSFPNKHKEKSTMSHFHNAFEANIKENLGQARVSKFFSGIEINTMMQAISHLKKEPQPISKRRIPYLEDGVVAVDDRSGWPGGPSEANALGVG
jgi:hypothetical protein